MKRILFVVLLAAVVSPLTIYAQTGLHVRVFGTGNLEFPVQGIGSYARGAGVGAKLSERLGFLSLGLEAKAEYDTAYSAAAFPVTLDLGLGDGFWLLGGTTFGTNPTFEAIPLKYRGFFNTLGLGFEPLNLKFPIGRFVLIAEVTYTLVTTADPSTNLVYALGGADVEAALLGFTGYLGAGLAFSL